MSVVALECKRCGGMLPSPGGGSPFVTCSFCGMSHVVSAPAIALTAEVRGPSDHRLRTAAAERAWDAARASSTDPVVALRAVVAEVSHALKSEQELERAARLTEALANGFDQANGTQTVADKAVVLRLAEAAVKALIELNTTEATEINLPFLTVGASGPLHLLITVPRARLAELDAMGVFVVREAAAPPPAAITTNAPAQESPAKSRRKWWQFG